MTPATASAPYMAEAPLRKTSTRASPVTGMEFMLAVVTGTRPGGSVCTLGWLIILRPLIRTRVLPVPRLRRLIDDTSPRAPFTPPVIERLALPPNDTAPAPVMCRKRSSPDDAPLVSGQHAR